MIVKIDTKKSVGVILASTGLCLAADTHAQGISIDSTWRDARNRAMEQIINPDDHEREPTVFDYWVSSKVYEMGVFDFDALALGGALDWSAYYSLLYDNDASDDFIGVHGEYTELLRKRHKDNQRFWDVATDDVLLLGMHGSAVADDVKMVPTVIAYYLHEYGVEIGELDALEQIDLAQAVIEGGTEVDLWSLLAPLFGPPPAPEDEGYQDYVDTMSYLQHYVPQGIPGAYNHPFLRVARPGRARRRA